MEIRRLDEQRAFSEEKLRKLPLFETGRFFLDVYCLLPGQVQKPHAHESSDKVYLVIEGSCRFVVDEAVETHGPGTAILAPAGSVHGVENIGDAPARLLVWMSPPPGASVG